MSDICPTLKVEALQVINLQGFIFAREERLELLPVHYFYVFLEN